MGAAGVARRLQPELARGIAAEHVTLQHAVLHELAIARRDAFAIERAAAERLADVRPLTQLEERREHGIAGRAQQERALAVLTAAADRTEKMTDQSARDFRRVQHTR